MTRTGRPTTLAFNGMIATPHALASAAGLAVLQEGGSAADAVIAANAVLTVIYPDQTAIGGDCFALYHEASSGEVHALNGSGRSPKAADREALRAAGHRTHPRRGIHAVTVPGTIDAWHSLHARFGRLDMERLLKPAIGYARDGFPLSPNVHESLRRAVDNPDFNESWRAVYLPGVTPAPAGSRMRLPALADSLERIARDGRDLLYTGEIAEKLITTSKRLGGSFTMDDLAGHRAEWVAPVMVDYNGVTVVEFPPNSQGITAQIALNLVENRPDAPWGSADHLHPLIEAKKRAFTVRDQVLADPAFIDIDIDRLVSKAYAAELGRGYDPLLAGAGDIDRSGDTVYLCAVDGDGNAASIIQSIYLGFGSGVLVEDTGILLQCRGAYFSLDDDHPNRLEGGKRTLHTLMPGMVLKDGKLLGPIGTQGGDAQAQVHLQLITNLVDYGMEPQAAIEAPRWVAGGSEPDRPRYVGVESRFPGGTIEELRRRGHDIDVTTEWNTDFGHAQMILRDPESGLLRGGADPRADGVAVGF
jgi:gamma-glutamyltranspeptidase/glutathione hydrolase